MASHARPGRLAITVHPVPGPPVGEAAVGVSFDPKAYARREGPSSAEASLETTWSERVAANPRLFNGTKFRWAGWEPTASGGVSVRLGLSSYRSFQGTNTSDKALDLMRHGLESFGDSGACLSGAVGIGMVVLTSDDQVLFIRRSQHVGEARGLVDVVGGHAEPSAAGLAPPRVGDTDEPPPGWAASPRLRRRDGTPGGPVCDVGSAARCELFASPLDEVVEEMNLPRTALAPPRILGITRNGTTGGRVALSYVVLYRGTAAEAAAAYREGAPEAFESTSMLHASAAALVAAAGPEPEPTAELVRGQGAGPDVPAICGLLEEGAGGWERVGVFSLEGAFEVPSPRPGGAAPDAGAPAAGAGPLTIGGEAIAPACAATLALFARAAERAGGLARLREEIDSDAE